MATSSSDPTVRGSQPPVAPPLRSKHVVAPDRLYVLVPGLDDNTSRQLSRMAVRISRGLAPKLSGRGAEGIEMYWGTGFFGVRWDRPYIWTQEAGARPFTMRNIAGKTIPMWIDDPTGSEHARNPKARTRITVSGKKQVLIFRKAAKIGQRKIRRYHRPDGTVVTRDVPASYPGAPGRIGQREITDYPGPSSMGVTSGRIANLVTRAHIGVRWRFPGITGRGFMHEAIRRTCVANGLGTPVIHQTYRRR